MTDSTPEDTCLHVSCAGWEADLSAVGGQVFRLRHVLSGPHELLRTPPDREHLCRQRELWGLPVLFPPNRIAHGHFRFEGRTYALPVNEPSRGNHIHGMLLGARWTWSQPRTDRVLLRHVHAPDPGWPHEFLVELEYVFATEQLTQTIAFTNCSDKNMPFLLGFHSAFQVTQGGRIRITARPETWTMDEQTKLPDGLRHSSGRDWRYAQTVDGLGKVSQLLSQEPDGDWCGMELANPAAGYGLRYDVDPQFRFWMLWNGDGQSDFFCAEPMTCMVNAPNLELSPEDSGMSWLEPGMTRILTSHLRVLTL